MPSSPGTAMFKMEVLGFLETPETTRLTTASHSDDLNRHQHRSGSSSNARLPLVTDRGLPRAVLMAPVRIPVDGTQQGSEL